MTQKIEDIRFLKPNGDFIFSPEGHQHIDVIHELHLSKKSGFEAIVDLVLSGYALISVFGKKILITHTQDINEQQLQSIHYLKRKYESFEVCISREEIN